VVVSIPRGGIPLARVVADTLDCDFDICLVRRIPAAVSNRGSSIAAVTEQGDILLSQPSSWGVSRSYIERERIKMLEDIRRRRLLYACKPQSLKRREVILIDDCIASGASMLAALHAIRKQRPSRIVIASPFCSLEAKQRLQSKCDELIVLHFPTTFVACAQFYMNFPSITDIEVMDCIRSQRERIYRRNHRNEFTENMELIPNFSLTNSDREDSRGSKSRASSSSFTSSSDVETERKDEDELDASDAASFRVHRAQSWADALLNDSSEPLSLDDYDDSKEPPPSTPRSDTSEPMAVGIGRTIAKATSLVEMELAASALAVPSE